MSALKRGDRDLLARFGIDHDLITQAGIYRVTDHEAREQYGMKGPAGSLSGVIYSLRGPDGEVHAHKLRRDLVPEGHGKYHQQDRAHWGFPPEPQARCADPNVPVVFVESVTSMLMLEAINTSETTTPLLPIALGGAYNWRGRIGKRTDANGARGDEHGPLKDFQAITWTDRDVVILFDSNTDDEGDPDKVRKLRKNRDKFAGYLTELGAKVRIGVVPTGVNGPDDYRAQHNDDAVLTLLDQAQPWAAASKDDDDDEKKPSVAQLLVELAHEAGAEPFHDEDQVGYVQVPVNGHHEVYPLRSQICRQWLTREFYTKTSRVPHAQGLADALVLLTGQAQFEGPQRHVAVRLAWLDGTIYLDLGRPEWNVVAITRDGWQVVSTSPVAFRRPKGMQPLPVPVRAERDTALTALRLCLDVPDDVFTLTVGWLISTLNPQPTMSYANLNLTGEQGSGKTYRAQVLRRTVDPNVAPLSNLPSDPRDLAIAARQNWIVGFDNLSTLRDSISDDLCRMSTGSGLRTRELYSNDDEMIFAARRPVLFNGISSVVERPDLLERTITVELPVIRPEDRRTESDLWSEFEQWHPAILGLLLDATATALARQSSVRLRELPRLADFALWVTAAEPALGWEPGTIVRAFNENKLVAERQLLANDLVGAAIELLVTDTFSDTMKGLHDALCRQVGEDRAKLKEWPKTPRGLGSHLRRLAPALRRAGISLTIGAPGRDGVPVTLERRAAERSQRSPSAPDAENANESGGSTVNVDVHASSPDGGQCSQTGAADVHGPDPDVHRRSQPVNGKSRQSATCEGRERRERSEPVSHTTTDLPEVSTYDL